MNRNDIGVMGMAVMGSNLALNMADHGYEVAIYNRTFAVGQKVYEDNPDKSIHLYQDMDDFVLSLATPRKIIIMVKAGDAVDKVIDSLMPLLDPNDIIMDGGNSNYQDTQRRFKYVSDRGFRYLGVGISGGEEGARTGPAIMPGGSEDAYREIAPIFETIAAQAFDEPCCTYIGNDGAGHYVKMVHNGIEYADMQLIAESYSILKHVGNFTNDELGDVFTQWNQGELESYLIEITAQIFKTIDSETQKHLVDVILDKAGQKGTGKWTVEEALATGTDTSLIASAVFARFMSADKDNRIIASETLAYTGQPIAITDKPRFARDVQKALYASKIIAYAQGFALMRAAGSQHNWHLNYGNIAKIFRGGCIIRAKFLNRINQAYLTDNHLTNLLLDPSFVSVLSDYQTSLRSVIALAIQSGISIPAYTSAISYYDAYRTADSNANLIQAQRDLFGAHTFERSDQPGLFHHQWGDYNES